MMKNFYLLAISFFVLLSASAQNPSGRTMLYKRVMIVENNTKKTTNDDAHFITFNDKGCYASDEEGFSLGYTFMKFIKHQDNLHCYSGAVDGTAAEIFFSNDYSRINIRVGNKTYVYQKEPGRTTNAPMRPARSRNNGNGTVAGASQGIQVIPNATIGGNESSSSNNRKTSRVCPGCNGTGKSHDEINYSPDYTGNGSYAYCERCGRTMQRHTHIQKTCAVCNGRGRIE